MDDYRKILNGVLDDLYPLVEHMNGLAAICEATGADAQRDSASVLTTEELVQAFLSMRNIFHDLAHKISCIYQAADTLEKELRSAE